MLIRPYQTEDCAAMARLFYDTVHTVNARDYTPEQLAVWAAGQVDLAAWSQSFLAHTTLVAEENGQIVGFGDMDGSGYLDRLYVHRGWQGRGVASALCQALEAAVPAKAYTTQASITAKPFFLRRGWQVLREQQVERGGVLLTNYVMEKPLPGSPGEPADERVLFFFSPHPHALPLYERLEKQLLARLGDFERRVQKTQISFYQGRLFGCASFNRVRKGLRGDFLTVTFGLGRQVQSPRLTVVEPYPGRWTHHAVVTDPKEIDQELLDWLAEAAAFSAAKGR
jgi:putative acetyltransferase